MTNFARKIISYKYNMNVPIKIKKKSEQFSTQNNTLYNYKLSLREVTQTYTGSTKTVNE